MKTIVLSKEDMGRLLKFYELHPKADEIHISDYWYEKEQKFLKKFSATYKETQQSKLQQLLSE